MNSNIKLSGSVMWQQGIGLIEVLISLLLLAVAILGFSAMQMRAVGTTDESMMRTRALTVMRGGAEAMRANDSAIKPFKTAINRATVPTTAELEKCMPNANATTLTGKTCSLSELAERDALVVKKFAIDNDIQIALVNCSDGKKSANDTAGQQCFIASWKDTKPTYGSADDACADANGVYKSGSHCFILEAYSL